MAVPTQDPSSLPMRALLAGARRKQSELLDLTRKLVLAESPSDEKAAVDACVDLAAAHAKALDGRIKRHRQRQFGDVLELRFGPRQTKSRPTSRVLVLGHLDTVWPLGAIKTMPCHIKADSEGNSRLWGPGTLDMKAGVAMAFTALEMLLETGQLGSELILLLNSEEEIGSPVSRPITEKLARESSAVFVLEPAQGLAYKTSRKGTGSWRLTVQGVAAHAGVDFTRGRSAILELARQTEKISAWTNLERGTTVNVGVIGGGTKSNVIPAAAWAEVDVRVARRADGPRMEKRFAALKPTPRSGVSLLVEGGINRPPMERTRGTVKLFRRAQALAAQIDWQLTEAGTGGASDGNFTSALGIPTLDGMGAVGEGAHAIHESILIDHLAPRTALLAAMLAN
jgi:glutamate carboxypeptidase